MIWNIRVGGTNHRNVVDGFGDVGEKFADFDAALAVFFEFEGRGKGRAGFAFGAEVFHRQRLADIFFEGGFWVESIDVRRAAIGEYVDDLFGFGRELRLFWRERRYVTGLAPGTRANGFLHQGAEAERAQTHAATVQELPTRKRQMFWIQRMVRHSVQPKLSRDESRLQIVDEWAGLKFNERTTTSFQWKPMNFSRRN